MTTRRLGIWMCVLLCTAALIALLIDVGLLSPRVGEVVDDAAHVVLGFTASGLCWWTSRRVDGPERRWRRFMAVGMAGWGMGMAAWAWHRWFTDNPLPSPSLGDLGFFAMPMFAVPALLVLAVEPPRHVAASQGYASLVLVLDGLIVAGSLSLITWSTAFGMVVRTGVLANAQVLVGIGWAVTDLTLVTVFLLLIVTGRVPQRLQVQLWLLGGGLLALFVSDTAFAYLVSTGGDKVPLVTDAGYLIGPALIVVAAVATADDAPSSWRSRARATVERAHPLLPLVLVVVTMVTVGVQLLLGRSLGPVEFWVIGIVAGLVMVRLGVTIVDHSAVMKELSEAKKTLTYQAAHDPLTGLPNRLLFNERLESAMERRRDGAASFALLVIDLDDFKVINDNLGHAAGDRLLHLLGKRLEDSVRDGDTVARLGGDEFAVVLEGNTEAPGVVAERILSVVQEPYEIDGRILRLGASVGVVEADSDEIDLTVDSILRRADGAMYVGKRRGKAAVVQYAPELVDEMPHL